MVRVCNNDSFIANITEFKLYRWFFLFVEIIVRKENGGYRLTRRCRLGFDIIKEKNEMYCISGAQRVS